VDEDDVKKAFHTWNYKDRKDQCGYMPIRGEKVRVFCQCG
jgi:hypothetical protein